jgi:hypothetical protein
MTIVLLGFYLASLSSVEIECRTECSIVQGRFQSTIVPLLSLSMPFTMTRLQDIARSMLGRFLLRPSVPMIALKLCEILL